MDTRFAITEYPDAAAITAQLDALIKKPIYSINRAALKRYEEEYFEKKCAKSKEMITEAKNVIPGGVQHNLAFNYPFPIVMTKAKGNRLYDIDGNEYFDFLQAGGPTIIGSNDDVVKEKVKELLDECGPSTGLFHPYEYKLAKKISECFPSVEMFRMLGSGTESCMCAVRVARLATGHKNIIKMGGATTVGLTSLRGVCVFLVPLIFNHTVFLCLYLSIHRNSSLMTLKTLKRNLSSISSVAVQLLYLLNHAVLNQLPVLLIRTSLRVFRLFAVSMALFLFAMKL